MINRNPMQIRDLLEIISQYDVVLSDIPSAAKTSGEVDIERKKIYIDKNQTLIERVDTLIHECLHVYHDKRQHIRVTEAQIIKETDELMRTLYGEDYRTPRGKA